MIPRGSCLGPPGMGVIMLDVSGFQVTDDIRRAARKTDYNVEFIREKLGSAIRQTGYFAGPKAFYEALIAFHRACKEYPNIELPGSPNRKVLFDEKRIGRFLRGEDKAVSKDDFTIVVYLLAFNNLLTDGRQIEKIARDYKDPLFFSLANFLKVGDITLANMTLQAPGLYTAYRPSSTFPGTFWRGFLEVRMDEISGATITKEFYQSGGYDNRPNKEVEFDGYMIRKSRHYTIIARNESISNLSVTFIPSVTLRKGVISTLVGRTMDMSTGYLYGSRVFYERSDWTGGQEDLGKPASYVDRRNQLLADCKILREDEMPDSLRMLFRAESAPSITFF